MYLPIDEDLMHALLVSSSVVLLLISLSAYRARRETRYFFLMLAFTFLVSSQVVTLFETIFLTNTLVQLPLLNLHLSHLFDLLMLLNFGLALTRGQRGPKPA